MAKTKPLVAIIMGSDSDWPVMKNAAQMLADFGVEYTAEVVSAHRTPDKMFDVCRKRRQRRLSSDYRGRRRRGAFARNGSCKNHAARTRRASADQAFDSQGTGKTVIDATMPGKCAAPPAPAMMT